MSWTLIIGLIVALLPYLISWLQKLFAKTAKSLPEPDTFATPEAATVALFDAAIQELPKRKYGRRMLLRVLKRIAVARAPEVFATARGETVTATPLTADEAAELADASAAGK